MNKLPALLGVFIFLSLPAFSLDFSTGYGITLGANFDTLTAKLNDGMFEVRQSYNQFNYGGLVFFDAVYVTADISFNGNITRFVYNDEVKKHTYINDNYVLAGANLGFGVYAKYPFEMDRLLLFPILGLQASIGLSQNFITDFEPRNAKQGNSYGKATDWSALAFKAGAGVDVDIDDTVFFRAGLLFIYKLNSLLDQAFVEAINNSGEATAINTNIGFELEFLIGYKIGGGSGRILPSGPKNDGKVGGDDIYYPQTSN